MILQTTASHLFKTLVKRSQPRKESLDRQWNDPSVEEIFLACQQIQSEWPPQKSADVDVRPFCGMTNCPFNPIKSEGEDVYFSHHQPTKQHDFGC